MAIFRVEVSVSSQYQARELSSQQETIESSQASIISAEIRDHGN